MGVFGDDRENFNHLDEKNYKFGECIIRTNKLSQARIIELQKQANHLFAKQKKTFVYKFKARKIDYFRFFDKGLYEIEVWDRQVRRTSKKVSIRKKIEEGKTILKIDLLADYPDISAENPVKIIFKIGKKKYYKVINSSMWETIEFPILEMHKNYIDIKWAVNRTWNPLKIGKNLNDSRDLGITVGDISFFR